MRGIYRILALLILIAAALLGTAGVCHTAPIPGFDVWKPRTTDDILKSWIIEFNKPAASVTVNNDNIFITDVNNRPLAATLSVSTDGASVTIEPVNPYTMGGDYWLFVTSGVCARGADNQIGAPLSKPLALPFTVSSQSGYIQSVSSIYHTLLTAITVTTSKAVHSVTVNGADTQYLGDNRFKLGLPGLAPGAMVVVKAYDGSGKLLVTQDYTVN